MDETRAVQINCSQPPAGAMLTDSESAASPTLGQSLEAHRLQLILNALETLNTNISQMEHHLSEMVNQGVKVKWLK